MTPNLTTMLVAGGIMLLLIALSVLLFYLGIRVGLRTARMTWNLANHNDPFEKIDDELSDEEQSGETV